MAGLKGSTLPAYSSAEEAEDMEEAASMAASLRGAGASSGKSFTGSENEEEEDDEGPKVASVGAQYPRVDRLLAMPVNPNTRYTYSPPNSKKVYIVTRIK